MSVSGLCRASCLFDWPTGGLIDRSIDWLNVPGDLQRRWWVWAAGGVPVRGEEPDREPGLQAATRWQTRPEVSEWWIEWTIDWFIDWLNWLIGWLIDLLIDWWINWLIDWLIDWLTRPEVRDCSVDWSMHECMISFMSAVMFART